ncbi:hypothetical protein M5K25_007424 [Dendrobium thyrsiflorum]|uniref:Uncharacterized protein n=1 Tax=Dendrobium thyrsiflorum TaxID=117978 RepID=A0ABD0VE76_DENTH
MDTNDKVEEREWQARELEPNPHPLKRRFVFWYTRRTKVHPPPHFPALEETLDVPPPKLQDVLYCSKVYGPLKRRKVSAIRQFPPGCGPVLGAATNVKVSSLPTWYQSCFEPHDRLPSSYSFMCYTCHKMFENSTTEGSDVLPSSGGASIPPQLKFLMTTIKNVIIVQLTAKKHLTWRSQVLKVSRANNFEGYLDGSARQPPCQVTSATGQVELNPQFSTWLLIDQNLAIALLSTISTNFLPYILILDFCTEIWNTLKKRLQSTNRSRII